MSARTYQIQNMAYARAGELDAARETIGEARGASEASTPRGSVDASRRSRGWSASSAVTDDAVPDNV
jgi:hypothetical protein